MSGVLLSCAAFAAALGGFTALGLAMDRHHEGAFGRASLPGRGRRWLQAGGSAMLLLSLDASRSLQGASVGWVLWFGMLTLAALAVVAIFSYWPTRAWKIATASTGLALIAWGLWPLSTR